MTLKQACWDVESSGVNTQEDRIITAFISLRDGERVVSEHSWVIDPGIEIPEEASAVHGMTTEWVREHGRKDVEQAIFEIADTLANAAGDGYVITGYNNSFDLAILDSEVNRHHGVEGLPALVETKPRFIDPIILDRAIDKYRKGSRKLADVARHYGIEFNEAEAHAADYDVKITAQLVPKVLNAAYKAIPELQGLTPDEIIDTLQGYQKTEKAKWAAHLTEYFQKTGKTEEDGSAIVVNGNFPW